MREKVGEREREKNVNVPIPAILFDVSPSRANLRTLSYIFVKDLIVTRGGEGVRKIVRERDGASFWETIQITLGKRG